MGAGPRRRCPRRLWCDTVQPVSAQPGPGASWRAELDRLLAQARAAVRTVQVAGSVAAELAGDLLATLASVVGYEHAAVFTGSVDHLGPESWPGAGVLHRLAARPTEAGTAGWDADLGGDSALAAAWHAGVPKVIGTQHRHRSAGHRPGSALALPVGNGSRPVALVALETRQPGAYPADVVEAAYGCLAGSAARLELALILDEVRMRAAAEERRWLAREVHDGISQDLAAFGYTLDEVIADGTLVRPAGSKALAGMRRHLSELVRDVRGTLGELRAEVSAESDLGDALADRARRLAERSRWTLHLDLETTGDRLPPVVEAEMFRIGQEALVNVAKHASAGQVWLTCHVAAPSALITVVDDGTGHAASRPGSDSYGFVTMSERALRLGASLSVRERRPTGTFVEVRLGAPGGPRGAVGTTDRREQGDDERDSVQAEQDADPSRLRR